MPHCLFTSEDAGEWRAQHLCPDAKSQVTIEYRDDHIPLRVHSVVISAQHNEQVQQETLYHDMCAFVQRAASEGFVDTQTIFHINPTRCFVIEGPVGDCGLTGSRIIVDTYGGMGRHDDGAFSGKDATKDIVAAGVARR